VNQKSEALNGEKNIRLLDKGFVPSKEYKSNNFSKSQTGEGTYHVTL